MAKKLFIKTHGCQMNEYDSARMADLLGESHQLELTDDEGEADVILLNTCSIREKAQEKVFHQLGRWKKLKEANPDLVIGVGGCVASQEGEALRKRAPHVDMVFGPRLCTGCQRCSTRAATTRSRWWTSLSPRSRNSTTCPSPARTAPLPSSR